MFQRYHDAAAKLVDVPWSIVVGGDYAFAGLEGKRTLIVRGMRLLTPQAPIAAAWGTDALPLRRDEAAE